VAAVVAPTKDIVAESESAVEPSPRPPPEPESPPQLPPERRPQREEAEEARPSRQAAEVVAEPQSAERPAAQARSSREAAEVVVEDESSRAPAAQEGEEQAPSSPPSPQSGHRSSKSVSSPGATGRPPLAPGSPGPPRGSRGRQDDHVDSTAATGDAKQRPDEDGDKQAQGKSSEMLGRDLFRRAEALCAQQRHEEAIPLFEEVLQVLRERGQDVLDRRALVVAQADVWAHLGVSMQSLDRMHEALASYGRAVALNPLLHACFANLATLHLYLRNNETARRHIGKALAVKPDEAAYLEIQKEVDTQAKKYANAS